VVSSQRRLGSSLPRPTTHAQKHGGFTVQLKEALVPVNCPSPTANWPIPPAVGVARRPLPTSLLPTKLLFDESWEWQGRHLKQFAKLPVSSLLLMLDRRARTPMPKRFATKLLKPPLPWLYLELQRGLHTVGTEAASSCLPLEGCLRALRASAGFLWLPRFAKIPVLIMPTFPLGAWQRVLADGMMTCQIDFGPDRETYAVEPRCPQIRLPAIGQTQPIQIRLSWHTQKRHQRGRDTTKPRIIYYRSMASDAHCEAGSCICVPPTLVQFASSILQ
jgi:hypothetical protein